MSKQIRNSICIAKVCVIASLLLLNRNAFADAKANLNELTGGLHSRVIWLQGSASRFNGGKLMGFDSQTGKEHQILPNDDSYRRPLLYSGGHRVIITKGYKVYSIDFMGTAGLSHIVDGEATSVWKDPASGKEWVVVHDGAGSAGPISRYMIEDPSKKVVLYAQNNKNGGVWQISGDGKIAVAFLPWPDCYFITDGASANNKRTKISNGCWSSVSPDDSHYWFHLTCCPHGTIKVFKDDTFIKEVSFDAKPLDAGVDLHEFYHPKFAAKGKRFMVLTGGYHGNKSSDDAEIYVGRFAVDFKSFSGWARITTNSKLPDYNPEAWIGVESLGPPELTYVSIEPSTAAVNVNDKVTFTLTTLDQSGKEYSASGNVTWSVSSGGTLSNKTNSGAVFTSDGTVGTFTVTAQVDGKSGSAQIRVTDPSTLHIRVNSGGPQVDDNGITWEAGSKYVKDGADYSFGQTHDVSGVTEPAPNAVYQTVRHQNHSYNFADIANGEYTVRIHFTDGGGDGRAMDYTIEDKLVLDDFNITDAVGGAKWKVIVKEFALTVADGNGLQIVADKDAGNDAFEAAIEVIVGTVTTQPAGETITMSEPDGSQSYKIGETMNVKWTASDGVDGITIQLSIDGGLSWEYITEDNGIQTNDTEWGNFIWKIPATLGGKSLVSLNVLVKVADYFEGGKIFDQSEKEFAITVDGDVRHDVKIAGNRINLQFKSDMNGLAISCRSSAARLYAMRIIDAAGGLVKAVDRLNTAGYTWPVGALCSGVYLLRLETSRGVHTRLYVHNE